MLDVCDNGDYGKPRTKLHPIAHHDLFSYGILAGPEMVGHCFINDCDTCRACSVSFCEIPPFSQWDAQRTEVVRTDQVKAGIEQLA